MSTNEELKTVKEKIRKLLSLGMSNSFNEAQVAMGKATKLMQEWALSIDDIELGSSDIIHEAIDTGSKKRGDLDRILVNLAKLYSCKIWIDPPNKFEKNKPNVILHVMGYDTDVEMFKHFYRVIGKVFHTSLERFKQTTEYENLTRFQHGKIVRTQFRSGFVNRVNTMICQFIEENGVVKTKTGTSIVLLKSAKIEDHFQESMGLKLRKPAYSQRARLGGANTAGSDAANKIRFDRPVENSTSTLLIGN